MIPLLVPIDKRAGKYGVTTTPSGKACSKATANEARKRISKS
jgi:hypothetical protein